MPEGTRDGAREVLARILESHLSKVDDPGVISVLQDGALLDDVFEIAWQRQFDRDRTALERDLRDVIQSAVAEEVKGDVDSAS